MQSFPQNTIGATLVVKFVNPDEDIINISGATTLNVAIKQPNGATLNKTGSFVTDGTDGLVRYTTIAGDLAFPGMYQIQAYAIGTGFTWPSIPDQFFVVRAL